MSLNHGFGPDSCLVQRSFVYCEREDQSHNLLTNSATRASASLISSETIPAKRLVGATCFRAECPVCYQKWASREAGAIEDKFKRLSRNNAEARVPGLGRPIHVVIGVPEADAPLIHDNFKKLRSYWYYV